MDNLKKQSFLEKVRPGDIITVDGSGFVDGLISWVTSSKEDHDCVYAGADCVVEAQNFVGVRMYDVKNYLDDDSKKVYISRVKDATDAQIKVFLHNAVSFVGIKYDTIGLIGILAKYMVKKIGLSWFITFFGKNRIQNAKQLWCSELTAKLWELVGIKLVDEDASYVTPSEIFASDKLVQIDY